MAAFHISDFFKAENLIASFAALTALASLLLSWRSLVIAKKGYVLSKQDHDEKYHDISPHLIEAIKWIKSNDETYVSFAASYSNKASLPTSLVNIELEITWRADDGALSSVYVQAETNTQPIGRFEHLDVLSVPLSIPPKESRSGWITFKVPTLRHKKAVIDRYRLVASAVNGSKIFIETYLLLTVHHEDD